MTLKKNYERRESGELRRPKNRPVKNREEARIKHALRHGDTLDFVAYDEEDLLAGLDMDYEADSD